MKVAVINASWPAYNLGAVKLAAWRRSVGDDVDELRGDPGMFAFGYDLVAICVVFSWDAPKAVEIACRIQNTSDVWAGGPGLFALARWFESQTGIKPHLGIDERFDRQRGDFKFCFASRGCPSACSFCIVPRIEGTEFRFDPDFDPAPVLCDNNLSALPVDYQQHIIDRYNAANVSLKDANSGFEPRYFDGGTLERWEPLLARGRADWRFALDEMREKSEAITMMKLLSGLPARRKRAYCLCGNEPIATCYERAQTIIENGCEPYVQMLRPLNALSKDEFTVKHDWSPQLGRDFQRYYNGRAWRSSPIWEYAPRVDGYRPFAALEPRVVSA